MRIGKPPIVYVKVPSMTLAHFYIFSADYCNVDGMLKSQT